MNGRSVVSRHFPYLPVHVFLEQFEADIEPLLDTGFDGDLIVPAGLFAPMPPEHFNTRWTLADGSSIETPMFNGRAQIGSLDPFQVRIGVLGSEPILGRGVISRFRVLLDHGAEVTLQP